MYIKKKKNQQITVHNTDNNNKTNISTETVHISTEIAHVSNEIVLVVVARANKLIALLYLSHTILWKICFKCPHETAST